ncbi:MAG: tRNA (adenosine(37)-N6)-threonylcarbamoyltransferase complex ATPase subunit type 1 TsaE [Fusobacteria bacterium]|nr:tRNA (adenosine(37)-N6)-threonylcarbamoyltransferase complex ATPase subunit type 1 TsaE [Fusobacteriota bacterium]
MKYTLTFSQLDHFACKMAALVKAGDIILLNGDLGTGKTTWSKCFGKCLGVTQTIKSPTFNILSEYYSGRLPLFHFDVYRLNEPEDFFEIGLEHFQAQSGIMLIEWGNIIEPILELPYITLLLEHLDETHRMVSIEFTHFPQERKEEIEKCMF